MFGQQEILKLAELCRIGARAGRDIADVRMRNRDELYSLAIKAEEIAVALERIVNETGDAPSTIVLPDPSP